MGVTVGGLNIEDTFINGEDGDIEGTTTEIEDEDVTFAGVLLVETVRNSGSGGLVDDSENLHAGDGTGILGGLSLGIVEVSGHSDNGVVDLSTEVSLSGLLHLSEDEGTNLGWRILLATSLNPRVTIVGLDDLVRQVSHVLLRDLVIESTTDETLGGEEGVLWVLHGLALSDITNVTGAVLSERNN